MICSNLLCGRPLDLRSDPSPSTDAFTVPPPLHMYRTISVRPPDALTAHPIHPGHCQIEARHIYLCNPRLRFATGAKPVGASPRSTRYSVRRRTPRCSGRTGRRIHPQRRAGRPAGKHPQHPGRCSPRPQWSTCRSSGRTCKYNYVIVYPQ